MKQIVVILMGLFCVNVSAGSATPPGNFAAGLTVGSFYAVTGKYWVDKRSAVDFGIGFDDLALYADYIYHIPNMFGTSAKFPRETAGYFGGGGGVAFFDGDDSYKCGRWGCDRRTDKDDNGLFLRIFAGFEWYAAPTRFGVFAEAGPTILLTPTTDTDLDVQIGGRYYF